MTLQEMIKIFYIFETEYQASFRALSTEAADRKLKLWATLFANDDFRLVQAAVLEHLSTDTSHFMPSIGEIRERMAKIAAPQNEMTEIEAWGYVKKALRRSLYYADEEFKALPPICQKLVGSPLQLKEWALGDNVAMSVAQSNFMRSYRVRQQSERETAALPQDLRHMIGSLKRPVDMIGIEYED